jgi:hypothetical protein
MRRIAQLVAGIALLGGCGGVPTETTAQIQSQAVASRQSGENGDNGSAALRRDLATLRRVTAPFHNFNKAVAAGWSTKITDCMTDANGAGGMGFHYGNTGLINATVSVDKPELLLYEPDKNGRLHLVAVEYIIPYSFHGRGEAPPVLFGQQFKQNDTFNLWGLHAWVWKENPSGIFASWNPRVSCKYATAAAAMSH